MRADVTFIIEGSKRLLRFDGHPRDGRFPHSKDCLVFGKTHYQPQGISGVGLTTGASYRATGVMQENFNSPTGGTISETFMNNFRLIGPGRGNNLLVHQAVHVTTNANGDVTADVFNSRIQCK